MNAITESPGTLEKSAVVRYDMKRIFVATWRLQKTEGFAMIRTGWVAEVIVAIAVFVAAMAGGAVAQDAFRSGFGNDSEMGVTGFGPVMDGGFGGMWGSGADAVMVVSAELSTPDENGIATLLVIATPPAEHYTYSVTQAPGGPIRTEITLTPAVRGDGFADVQVKRISEWVADPVFESHADDAWGGLIAETHAVMVTWSAAVRFEKLPGDTDPATLVVTGKVFSQLCRSGACLPPSDISFTARVNAARPVGSTLVDAVEVAGSLSGMATEPDGVVEDILNSGDASVPVDGGADKVTASDGGKGSTAGGGKKVAAVFDPAAVSAHAAGTQDQWNFGAILGFAFLGGLILNLMPCVLPVLGLKVLSLVEQSGENRQRAFVLNIWYTFGILVIFWVLAALAILLQMSWGAQFQYTGFTVFMAVFVFAMALSLLGIWELPIPGFASGRTATSLSKKEGVGGAFFKGIVTTLLATPCSGPYLGTALAWTLTKPAWMTATTFTAMGLGMASPYLLIGVFPAMAKFVPKPGPWMDTLREILGFVLLGTVAFLLWTIPDPSALIPTLILGGVVWFGCWLIQRATLVGKSTWRAWLVTLLLAGVVTIFGFIGTMSLPESVPGWLRWFPMQEMLQDRYRQRYFSGAALEARPATGVKNPVTSVVDSAETAEGASHAAAGEPALWGRFTTIADFSERVNRGELVLIDFTADWCPTCKALETAVLHSELVETKIRELGVTALVADWTRPDPEVTGMLNMLRMRQVPVIAIFPAGRPNEPSIFADGYTQSQILDALNAASEGT